MEELANPVGIPTVDYSMEEPANPRGITSDERLVEEPLNLSVVPISEGSKLKPSNPTGIPCTDDTKLLSSGQTSTCGGSRLTNRVCRPPSRIVPTSSAAKQLVKECSVRVERCKPPKKVDILELPDDYEKMDLVHFSRMTVTEVIHSRWNVEQTETCKYRVDYMRSE